MHRFRFDAIAADGVARAGELEAADADGAAGQLRAQGLVPIAIRVARRSRGWGWLRRGRRVTRRDRAVFLRALGTLVEAGLPLVRALDLLSRQERHHALRAAAGAMAAAVRNGQPFSAAMRAEAPVFARLHGELARAGEAAGALGSVLERMARFEERQAALAGRLRAALAYPLVVLVVTAGVLAGLLGFVVPRFESIFADLLQGAPLPPLTRAVVAAAGLLRDQGLLLLLALGLAMGALRCLASSPSGARWAEHAVLAIPVLGPLLAQARIARCLRTLGTLLAAGVPILEALQLARGASGSPRLEEALGGIAAGVGRGEGVAAAFSASGAFPPAAVSLLQVGEETGRLAVLCLRVADLSDEEVESAVAGLGAVVEPVLIVLLAGLVGTIVVALFLPLVRTVQLLL